ncbi:MAG: hypothetical protein KBD21_02315, partial [Candidatus Pacebacteria bacterium]|nr:hypothetical protein [Candidatus Paceibacterota bacterium]
MQDSIQEGAMMPIKEAANTAGIVVQYMSRLCREGVVVGEKIDGACYVNRASLQSYLREREKAKLLRSAQLADERRRELSLAQKALPQAHERRNERVSLLSRVPKAPSFLFGALASLFVLSSVYTFAFSSYTEPVRHLLTSLGSSVVSNNSPVSDTSADRTHTTPNEHNAVEHPVTAPRTLVAGVFESIGAFFSDFSMSRFFAALFGNDEKVDDSERVAVELPKENVETDDVFRETTEESENNPQTQEVTTPIARPVFLSDSATATPYTRTLRIGADVRMQNTLEVVDDVRIRGSLSVSGSGTYSGIVTTPRIVAGTAQVNGNTIIGGSATVSGPLVAGGSLSVSGPSTLNSTLMVTGSATTTGSLYALGGINTGNTDVNAGTGSVYAANLLNSIVAGRNITIDTTDPNNPVISARSSGGGGGGNTTTTIIQGGTGNVTSGTIGQITYYSADGTTVMGTSSISIGSDGVVTIAGTASTTDLYVSGGFFQNTLLDCDTEPLDVVLYDATTGSFTCGIDDTGASVGVVDIYEGGTATLNNAVSIAFDAQHFNVIASGTQAIVSIDFANSGVTRASSSETITGVWSFANTVTAPTYAATSTTATSTFFMASTSRLALGSDYLTDLTGTGLILSGSSLTVDSSVYLSLADFYATSTLASTPG